MNAPLRRTSPDPAAPAPGAAAQAPRPSRPPPPATVRYNDWPCVPLPDADAFSPVRPVSVVVPTYRAAGPLALTLAGLERQDYPRELLEVVVVDDGSDPPVQPPADTRLDLRVVRQPRRGFGLARARNTGARAASHDILVFLDGDVIAEAGLIRAHARWHHAVGDALTQGFCAFVSADGIRADAVRDRDAALRILFRGRPFDPPWIERHMARTGDLTSRHADLFRAVTGHNFAISRALFEEAGGFDGSFDRYGGEDTEFGYRVQAKGGLLVPVREAFAWHQGRWLDGRAAKRREMAIQAGRLADLIPDPGFRPAAPTVRYAVPRHAVALAAGRASLERIVQTADVLLDDPHADMALCIGAGREGDRIRLERRYGNDPRVRVGGRASSIDAFPASPLHVLVPAGAIVVPDALKRLETALGDAAAARVTLDRRGRTIAIARAWALHRARRAGGAATDYGDVRSLPPRALRLARPARPGVRSRTGPEPHTRGATALARVRAEARHVRGARSAWRFVRWLLVGLSWRLRLVRGGAFGSDGRDGKCTDGR